MVDPKEKKPESKPPTCCQPNGAQSDAPWVIGSVRTHAGDIPVVDTTLRFSEEVRSLVARCGVRRTSYRVEPGLYAVGRPSGESPVFVSANYRMSFDLLRSQIAGIDSWILVLDTKGINVWCAAGKGTFGTDEIVNRTKSVRLTEVVTHRRLVLPQLGASGVGAHEVKKHSGFHVVYGPVRAQDLPAFMDAGMRATPQMRRVRFSFRDRVVLIPADLILSAKYLVLAAAIFLLLSGLGAGTYSLNRVTTYGVASAVVLLLAYVAGTILPPVLLPWLPGRPFSLKGAWVGFVLALGVLWWGVGHPEVFPGMLDVVAWLFIIPAVTSFIAMNFTGSSTYTSLSGVRKEMHTAMPIQISIAAVGLGLWITALFV
jgi:acetyl-CoA decarbonylase/synthase complex subunit gamma